MKRAILVMLAGLPGTGKSTIARGLCQHFHALLLQSDGIRREIVADPQYTPEESRLVYAAIHQRTKGALAAGQSVIIDATNLTEDRRSPVYQLADELAAPLLILWTVATEPIVRERLHLRHTSRTPGDLSDAGWDVYVVLRDRVELPSRPYWVVDTSRSLEPVWQHLREWQSHAGPTR